MRQSPQLILGDAPDGDDTDPDVIPNQYGKFLFCVWISMELNSRLDYVALSGASLKNSSLVAIKIIPSYAFLQNFRGYKLKTIFFYSKVPS